MREFDPYERECAYQLAVGVPEFGIYRRGFIAEAAVAAADTWKDSGVEGFPTPEFVMNWWEANRNDYLV